MTSTRQATTVLRNETTRYLCAGVHLDPDLADDAIREFLTEPLRAVPPSIAFDAPLVLREAVAARSRRLLRDWLVLVLSLLFFATAGIALAGGWLAVGLIAVLLHRAGATVRLRLATGRANVRSRRHWLARIGWPLLSCLLSAGVLIGISLLGTAISTALVIYSGGLPTLDSTFLPGVPGVVFGLLLFGVVVADRFALYSLLIRSFRRGSFTSRPTLTEWAGERWLRTLGHRRYQAAFERVDRSGNLVVYRGEKPFVGAGKPYRPISFAIPLEPANGSGDDVGGFSLSELYDHIAHELLALRESHSLAPGERLSGLTETEQVIVPASELLVNFGNPMSTLALPDLHQPPPDSVVADRLALLAEDSLEWMRYYRCFRVETWDRDVTLSIFLHLGAGERMLYLEWTPCLLWPVHEQYRRVDEVPIAPLAPLRGGFVDMLRLPYTLPARTVGLFRRLGTRYRAGAVWPRRYGSLLSLREMGSGDETRNYFQDLDVDRYVKVLQRRMIRAVGEFLEQRKISSTEFVTQAMSVTFNQTYVGSNVNYGVQMNTDVRTGGTS
jgi:hypothetical protein